MCECVVEYTGHKGFTAAWEDTWLRLADEEETTKLKMHRLKDCPTHTNKDLVLKRVSELKP